MWISLLADTPGRGDNCKDVILQASRKAYEIWTSSLTLAEVYKVKCDDDSLELAQSKDAEFENLIAQDYVRERQVDHDIGVLARRLLRAHPALKKPADGIHLATAVLHDCDEFHTYDGKNLLPLDGVIKTKSGKALKICRPPLPIQPDMLAMAEGAPRSAPMILAPRESTGHE